MIKSSVSCKTRCAIPCRQGKRHHGPRAFVAGIDCDETGVNALHGVWLLKDSFRLPQPCIKYTLGWSPCQGIYTPQSTFFRQLKKIMVRCFVVICHEQTTINQNNEISVSGLIIPEVVSRVICDLTSVYPNSSGGISRMLITSCCLKVDDE